MADPRPDGGDDRRDRSGTRGRRAGKTTPATARPLPRAPGGSYFFIVALPERRRRLLTGNIEALQEAFQSVRNQSQ